MKKLLENLKRFIDIRIKLSILRHITEDRQEDNTVKEILKKVRKESENAWEQVLKSIGKGKDK